MSNFYIGTPYELRVTLTDSSSAPVTTATVTFVATVDGGDVDSGALAHTSGGVYEGLIAGDIDVDAGDSIKVVVTAVWGAITKAKTVWLLALNDEETPCVAYPTRADVEAVFGLENVKKWADLDNDEDDGLIEARVQWACCEASAWLDDQLRAGPYEIPFAAPYPRQVIGVAARVAGVKLYESRGVTDVNVDGDPIDSLQVHREAAEAFVAGIMRGTLRLNLTRAAHTPGVVAFASRHEVTQ